AERLRAGDKFPPVDVFDDGHEKWVADGAHRLWASEQAGREEIDCLVHRGTKEDAQWFAIRANRSHGLRRSNADKRLAVEKALTHPKGADLSDRHIAEYVGVTHPMVIKCRKHLESTGKLYQSTCRVGRDGRRIDTARIGNGNQNATGKLYQSTCRVGDDGRSNATGKLYQSTCRVGDDGNGAQLSDSNVGFAAKWNAHHGRCEHLKRFSEQELSAADQFVQTAVDKTIDLFLDQVTQHIQDYAGMVCTPAVEKNGADPGFVAMLLVKALKENLDPLTISAPTSRTDQPQGTVK
ncbi:MAG: ParB N-terminal domain-containing protein, partial [Candidatus Nealsonbacteria bacterium]|nr:ParB N-terminal domain-containing protein [Candidatus Nealsonbacteria bacterium]